ncbi:protein spaetzle 3 [Caerostris extrusa]|uniref:Protein spaetzle 3 n=1 Tax=Caerostris extrusa TaxID=172846 RepID=A0AAV4RBT0_CAEEX|nr:protein spaetzle 3 [Caerostris extrusa]
MQSTHSCNGVTRRGLWTVSYRHSRVKGMDPYRREKSQVLAGHTSAFVERNWNALFPFFFNNSMRGDHGTIGMSQCSLSSATLAIFALTLWLEVCAEILRGYPCIRRKNQLYCPSPGNTYPNATEGEEGRAGRERRSKRDRIEKFIDENKALVKRMVGEYSFGNEDDSNNTPAFKFDQFETYDGHPVHSRNKRARTAFGASPNKVDACESAVEIVTPYWASNSAGKIRAIVNTQHLQQAIQQEVCHNPAVFSQLFQPMFSTFYGCLGGFKIPSLIPQGWTVWGFAILFSPSPSA